MTEDTTTVRHWAPRSLHLQERILSTLARCDVSILCQCGKELLTMITYLIGSCNLCSSKVTIKSVIWYYLYMHNEINQQEESAGLFNQTWITSPLILHHYFCYNIRDQIFKWCGMWMNAASLSIPSYHCNLTWKC